MYMEFYQNIKKKILENESMFNLQRNIRMVAMKVAYSKNQNCIELKCTSQKSNCKEFILE